MSEDTRVRIESILKKDKVVLFMKGTPMFPQCGFSQQAVAILKSLDVEFASVDVFEDPQIREGIKEYGNWPTLPQLYLNNELIGGCDILTEMYQSGELKDVLVK